MLNSHNSLRYRFRTFLCVILSFLCAVITTTPTFAGDDLNQPFLSQYGKAGALYYDPDGSSGFNLCVSGGSNTNYAGVTVLTEAMLQAVAENQPFYEAAAEKYGFPWQILAAVHYAEHNFLRTNPDNGQGIYQLYSYTNGGTNANRFPPTSSAVSDEEFARQTDIAASIIKGKIDQFGLDPSSSALDVMHTLYAYNGISSEYYQRAINMGFSQEEANAGAGSTYVMNRYDAQRDPTSGSTSPYWKGRYTSDGVYEANSTTDRFGTYVVYEALGGTGICGGLVSGGMTYEQAVSFMNAYKELQAQYVNCTASYCSPWLIQNVGCTGGPYSNCVAVPQYLINRYTTIGDNIASGGSGVGGLPSGINVVSYLLNTFHDDFIDGGHTPRAYAIFSTTGTDANGHTGIVLGIDEAAGVVYTGEAGCYLYDWTGVKTHTIEEMSSSAYSYAYTDNILKIGGEIVTGNSGNNGNSSSSDGSNILLIGDSITEGLNNYSLISNAIGNGSYVYERGRSFAWGIDILKNYNLNARNIDTIVFALGTNSNNVSTSQIQSVIDAANGRKVFFITNYKLNNASYYNNNNANFRTAANNKPNVYLIDWAAAVASDPSTYINSSDGYDVHPSAAGYQLLSNLIHQALRKQGAI